MILIQFFYENGVNNGVSYKKCSAKGCRKY